MVVVFGMDIPLFEMVFFVLIILLAALVILLIALILALRQVRELKGLLHQDTQEEIRKKISALLAQGHDWKEIHDALIQKGWSHEQLEAIKNSISNI